jgi:hypothetical protein
MVCALLAMRRHTDLTSPAHRSSGLARSRRNGRRSKRLRACCAARDRPVRQALPPPGSMVPHGSRPAPCSAHLPAPHGQNGGLWRSWRHHAAGGVRADSAGMSCSAAAAAGGAACLWWLARRHTARARAAGRRRLGGGARLQDERVAEQALRRGPPQRVLLHARRDKVPELAAARARRWQRHGLLNHLRAGAP